MKYKFLASAILCNFILLAAHAEQKTFFLTESSRGEYENGVYSQFKPEFSYRIRFDTQTGKAVLSEIQRLKTGYIIQMDSPFVLTAGDAMPLIATGRKKNEAFIILVGKTGDMVTEVFMIGDSYFEYVKIGQGRMYLASGPTKKTISLDEDLNKLIGK